MNAKIIGVLAAVGAGAGLLVLGQPNLHDRLARLEPELNQKIQSRQIQIDPAELLALRYEDQVGVRIFDLRSESDFNLFHLTDAQRVSLEQISEPAWAKELSPKQVIVLVSNDEEQATQAWKLLSTQKVANLYILAGGINAWIERYAKPDQKKPIANCKNDQLGFRLPSSLGSRHPAADPEPSHGPPEKFEKKVKSLGGGKRKAGGCG